MNRYLQQDTPTTETLLSKNSYIQMTESLYVDNLKTYWFSSLWGGGKKRQKKKIRIPWPFKSRDLFSDNKSIQRKMGPHIRIIANHSWG